MRHMKMTRIDLLRERKYNRITSTNLSKNMEIKMKRIIWRIWKWLRGENTGRPAIYIAEKSDNVEGGKNTAQLLAEYKPQITPHEYDYSLYENYLKENFDLEEISLEEMMKQNQIHFEIFQFNYSNCIFFAESKFDPIFFRIVKNQKSAWLYDQEGEEHSISVYIEKNTGFVETTSTELSVTLGLIRGVSEEEYKTDSVKLLNLISLMRWNEIITE